MKADKPMLIKRALTACVFLLSTSAAQAAIVQLEGATVDFSYDDTQPDMAVFGDFTVVGDSIFASPADFIAESIGGGSHNFSATATITVVAKSGYQFKTVASEQRGDYKVTGAGSTTVVNNLTIVDSNNALLDETTTLANSGLGINDGLLHEWSSIGQLDLSTAPWDSVTSINLIISSELTASTVTALGNHAFIQNKHVAGGLLSGSATIIETVVVPVPASIWLLLSGLLGLSGIAGRKR